MTQSSQMTYFSDQEENYLILYDQESNDFFYQYFMQQAILESKDQLKNTQQHKAIRELMNLIDDKENSCKICEKEQKSQLFSNNYPLSIDSQISSQIQTTKDSNKIQNQTKTEEIMSSTQVNHSGCLNPILKLNKVKRKYQHKNKIIKMDVLNIHTKPKDSLITELHKKRAQNNRKGKHSQSKTQKFIQFMTQYHYSKNFNQYLRKKIIENVTDVKVYLNLNPETKSDVISSIIQDLEYYQMSVHYSVQQDLLERKISHQKITVIKAFFHQVIRKTYKIKLQRQKKNLLNKENILNSKHRKFFDKKEQQEFDRIFQETLKQEPFLSALQSQFFDSIFYQASQIR